MKILVIDDEKSVRELLVDILHDYEVTAVKDGGEGLMTYINDEPDLTIIDLGLPDMSGQDVCREINRLNPIAPVIILTGSLDNVDNFVTVRKPFVVSKLRGLIEEMLCVT